MVTTLTLISAFLKEIHLKKSINAFYVNGCIPGSSKSICLNKWEIMNDELHDLWISMVTKDNIYHCNELLNDNPIPYLVISQYHFIAAITDLPHNLPDYRWWTA